MASLLEANRLSACTERLVACSTSRPRNLAQPLCRPTHGPEYHRRSIVMKATAGTRELPACAEAVAEAPAAADENFPDVHPEELSAFPSTEKYAVVEIGGVQMFVQEGRWYSCNRLEAQPGQKIKLGRVLALKENGKFTVGTPYLDSVSVTAEVVDEMKGPKLTIFKMRRKKHYRRKTGHRQPLTQFLVTDIKL